MSGPRFALVTPSYYRDHERCLLLIDSARRYVPSDIQHFIVVSRSDAALFAACAGGRTHVIVQEDMVQEPFIRLPLLPTWRVGWMTPPVRGWIWQQMVKMSIANSIDADAYMIMDSDCFFVRPFDPRALVIGGDVPMFREEKDFYETSSDHQKWAKVSQRLLRLRPWAAPYRRGYVGPGCFWRRDVLLALQAYLSNGRGATRWLAAVARNVTFSEYMLYGIFVDEVLGLGNSGHYGYEHHMCAEYWDAAPMTPSMLEGFARQIPEDRVLAMISARSPTPMGQIRAAFGY